MQAPRIARPGLAPLDVTLPHDTSFTSASQRFHDLDKSTTKTSTHAVIGHATSPHSCLASSFDGNASHSSQLPVHPDVTSKAESDVVHPSQSPVQAAVTPCVEDSAGPSQSPASVQADVTPNVEVIAGPSSQPHMQADTIPNVESNAGGPSQLPAPADTVPNVEPSPTQATELITVPVAKPMVAPPAAPPGLVKISCVLHNKRKDHTYSVLGIIGHGGFARVVRARTADGMHVAIKIMDKWEMMQQPDMRFQMKQEKEAYRLLGLPPKDGIETPVVDKYLVKLLESWEEDGFIYFVMVRVLAHRIAAACQAHARYVAAVVSGIPLGSVGLPGETRRNARMGEKAPLRGVGMYP